MLEVDHPYPPQSATWVTYLRDIALLGIRPAAHEFCDFALSATGFPVTRTCDMEVS